jgi:Zn-dependent peptidase ImmA (M78 family)/plasmid maintenance system antidote protein VapI
MPLTEEQQFTPDWFSKPGDSLLSLMRRRNVTASQLADTLDGGMEWLRGLLAGSITIDARIARNLARAVGGTDEFWLKRQANYEKALERAVSAIFDVEGEQLLGQIPAPDGKSIGHFGEVRKREELRRRLAFFGVSNLRGWNSRYGYLRSCTQFRTSPSFLSDERAVARWLRFGEIEAALTSTKPWNPNVLREKLSEIRKLSRISHPARFLPKLKNLCAEAGVAVVVLRAPKGCRASGATRRVADRAMILLSFRFRADDQFWFTLFHEIGHLLLHDAQTFIDDDETLEDEREQEANAFASNCIIPKERQTEFEHLPLDRTAILRFSISLGIAPGLIVGQMQHRGTIGREHFNKLKRHWTWDQIEPALG